VKLDHDDSQAVQPGLGELENFFVQRNYDVVPDVVMGKGMVAWNAVETSASSAEWIY
jgi:hypothetical protein